MTDKEHQAAMDEAYDRGVTHGWAEALAEVKRGEVLPRYRAALDAQMKEREYRDYNSLRHGTAAILLFPDV